MIYSTETLGSLARRYVGAPYKRDALIREAPRVFNCMSFIAWLFRHYGVHMPSGNLLESWLETGTSVDAEDLQSHDLVFTDGYINYAVTGIAEGIGHLAMVIEPGKIIHATGGVGVTEQTFEAFFRQRKFRAARRISL